MSVSAKIAPIAAIIPCRNEAGSIERLIDELRGIGVTMVVVAIDPASTDATADLAIQRGAHVVRSPVSGYDGPVLAGIRELEDFAGWVLFLDAGGKYVMATVGSLIAHTDPQAEMTFGIRDQQLFWHQRLGNNLFKVALWLRFRRHVAKDVSSVRLIRSEVIPQLQLEDRAFSLPFQTLVHGLKLGMRIDYVPIRCTDSRTGNSKVSGNPRNSARAATQMLLSIPKAPKFGDHHHQ
jgi:glycosyltransferase involved in cell wall biosynthesis